jgi:hypothetical protein
MVTLVACQTDKDGKQGHFQGLILNISDKKCEVEVRDNGNQPFASGDTVFVSIAIENCPELKAGDYIRVRFPNGQIAETLPYQIFNPDSIELTDEYGNSIE